MSVKTAPGGVNNASMNWVIIASGNDFDLNHYLDQYGLILTHWGRVTHICVNKLAIIVSDNGLSPGRRQAIIWTNAGIMLIGPLGTNFNKNLIEIQNFLLRKMHLKVSSGKWRPSCFSLNVLTRLSSDSSCSAGLQDRFNTEWGTRIDHD